MLTHVQAARNVNDALESGLWWLRTAGVREDSRNGAVLVAPGPVITETAKPMERVIFSPLRDANPFFHLLESLWMLDGRNDTASLTGYVARMQDFSDDGLTLNGAYGYRWRVYFGYDQLEEIVSELKANPASRRCVLQMWDGGHREHGFSTYTVDGDLLAAKRGSKDVPCNTACFFRIAEGKLHMTVTCRSNDAIWGAHGANAVHFSVLLEYMAAAIGVPVGRMVQVSNNYHIYADRPDVQRLYRNTEQEDTVVYQADNRYSTGGVQAVPLLQYKERAEDFLADCDFYFSTRGHGEYTTLFFRMVFLPLIELHSLHKSGAGAEVIHTFADKHLMETCDWHIAGYEWVKRRLVK